MRRRVAGPTSRSTLVVRGVVSTVVAVVLAVVLVGRGAGFFDAGATVTAVLPASAGRIPVNAPVHHLGLRVGDVRASEGTRVGAGGRDLRSGDARGRAGAPGSDDDEPGGVRGRAGVPGSDDEPGTRVELLIDEDAARRIPADVRVRVVPRTLFGDVRVDLVSPGGQATGATLTDGDVLVADTSEEAVLLYDVFSRASDLLVAIEPENLQITLTALARALDGRGEMLGRTIGDADRATAELSPAWEASAATSPAFALLAEDMADATPAILSTLEEATRLSRTVLDRPGALRSLLDAGLAATGSGAAAADRTVPGAIRLVGDTGVVFDRTARNPHGVIETLYAMRPMGESGAAAFASGRFNITAVPSFSDPMPYGPQDCPRYPGLDGSTCGGGEVPSPGAELRQEPGRTVSAVAERETLLRLQAAAASEPGSPVPAPVEGEPAAAAWTMLAPLVRGTEVAVR